MTERKHVDPGVWLSSQIENTAECAGLTTQSPPWLDSAGTDPAPDTAPRLRDIALLMLFAVLVRLIECFEKDKPGWWLERDGDD